MKPGLTLFICLVGFSILACKNGKNERIEGDDPGSVYFDYRIMAEEENEMVSCLFKFKYNGRNGRTIHLSAPANVLLDGEQLKADSAGFEGVYYELVKPLAEFGGRHQIIFTAPNKKQFREDFEFLPFALQQELPARVSKQPFDIKLNNLPETTVSMNIVMTDTSYLSNDVIDVIRVSNGVVKITGEMLARLVSGPIHLELSRDELKPLKERTRAGGRFMIRYGLKREFELID